MTYLCILGRQPALGLAELESRFGADKVSVTSPGIALLEVDEKPNFDEFGGMLKAGEVIDKIAEHGWKTTLRKLEELCIRQSENMPDGKFTLGLSFYGLNFKAPQINAGALSIKKKLKQIGRSVRVVPNKESELNSAQVLHNKLTAVSGLEILVVRTNDSYLLIAKTVWAQDIDAYRKRDHERPMRDSRVGMLPPKLAQIIINLAAGNREPRNERLKLIDPFCGTGVVLQEALLQGYETYGSDLDPRMVDYSRKNLDWLEKARFFGGINRNNSEQRDTPIKSDLKSSVEVGDATTHKWSPEPDLLACETYLGRPLSATPPPDTLKQIVHACNVIHKKFLLNIASQTDQSFRMCIAVPAWYINGTFIHLPFLDHLKELGYNRVSFVHARTGELIYRRENQIVARELVVLTRN